MEKEKQNGAGHAGAPIKLDGAKGPEQRIG